MVFFSDLDRTLIYSKKFIKDEEHIISEYKNAKPITYMAKNTYDLLKYISKSIEFVPVTTRTVEQYRRIEILNDFNFKYAITSNGGNLIIDGVIDTNYRAMIEEKLKSVSSLNEILKDLLDVSKMPWCENIKIADNSFIYMLVDSLNADYSLIESKEASLLKKGYKTIIHGRKVYFIPKCISKGDAINYIKKLLKKDFVISSGDSKMDEEMIFASNYFIVPRHGEIAKSYIENQKNKDNILVTKDKYLKSSYEIVNTVNKIFKIS
ncbi:HAD family hydrolase [Peptostreptococcaceae bacterium AGR-M142]